MTTRSSRARTREAPGGEEAAAAEEAAESAGLRYVHSDMPGIARRKRGRGFSYHDARGRAISDPEELARIRSIAVPPAWTAVWICPDPRGHLQATGRDAKGRKQYRYHPLWREVRDAAKYDRLRAFGEALPAIRRRVDRDLGRDGMPREKVVAAVLRLMDRTLIRVGNDEYARDNKSYGLTTMRNGHATVRGDRIAFRFKGKSGSVVETDVRDPRAARIVRRCRELPGQELFAYVGDDGEVHDIGSSHVNDYLRETAGQTFTAKDFRTWGGTTLAVRAFIEAGDHTSQRAAKRNVGTAIEAVAGMLGNTAAVCRRCYVHPAIVQAYLDGELLPLAARLRPRPRDGLRRDEVLLLRLLERLEQRPAAA